MSEHIYIEDCITTDAQNEEATASFVEMMQQIELNREEAAKHYPGAVQRLLDICLTHDGSGAKAAAQVLLSSYNGRNFQVKITDLCNLDPQNFQDCMHVIIGRIRTFEEPHNVIEDGSALFDELANSWGQLKANVRYQDMYGPESDEVPF